MARHSVLKLQLASYPAKLCMYIENYTLNYGYSLFVVTYMHVLNTVKVNRNHFMSHIHQVSEFQNYNGQWTT